VLLAFVGMLPTMLVGLARRVIASSTLFEPSSVIGSQPTIWSITSCRRASSRRTTPTIETRTIVSGASEKRTR